MNWFKSFDAANEVLTYLLNHTKRIANHHQEFFSASFPLEITTFQHK